MEPTHFKIERAALERLVNFIQDVPHRFAAPILQMLGSVQPVTVEEPPAPPAE